MKYLLNFNKFMFLIEQIQNLTIYTFPILITPVNSVTSL